VALLQCGNTVALGIRRRDVIRNARISSLAAGIPDDSDPGVLPLVIRSFEPD